MFLSSSVLLCLTLGLVSADVNWNGNNWANGCYFEGNELSSIWMESSQCGGKCASTPGCTHFTWKSGQCIFMKNAISKSQASATNDQSIVCGVMDNAPQSGGSSAQASGSGGSLGPKMSGKTTRYWDCCKPSCSWPGKSSKAPTPVKNCAKDGVSPVSNNDASGCNGGSAYVCNNQMPWVVNGSLSYGFVAGNVQGQAEEQSCCACYKIDFTTEAVKGQSMIVQLTNTGSDLSSNHFDVMIPGGGVGIFNGCQSQWNSPADGWGQRYGGISSAGDCNQLPAQIRPGCQWRFGWYKNANNPLMNLQRVKCPAEITNRSGCKRTDE